MFGQVESVVVFEIISNGPIIYMKDNGKILLRGKS
jgi:hypothetical protein